MTVDHRQCPVVTHTGIVLFVFSRKEKEELETSDNGICISLTMEKKLKQKRRCEIVRQNRERMSPFLLLYFFFWSNHAKALSEKKGS